MWPSIQPPFAQIFLELTQIGVLEEIADSASPIRRAHLRGPCQSTDQAKVGSF